MADSTAADRRPQPVSLVPLPDRDRLGASLPAPLTSFVGRAGEVEQVAALVRRPNVRLVTLTGPGGVGKTRLAIRVAAEVAEAFPDGVWLVALAPLRDPALVAATIAHALGLRETGTRPAEEAVRDFLRDRRVLLVLDNVEHLLDAGPLIPALLTACPALTVLVTSRAVLRLSGEHAVAVPPLALPTGEAAAVVEHAIASEAVRLFVERATAARSDFVLTQTDAPTVAAICATLDGVPLAIELAAARVRTLPPSALLRRLEHRLVLLTGGSRDQPARLRSMRDAIAWSDDLLTPAEQALFQRLAVFVGGFTLDAAAAVVETPDGRAGDAFTGVASLVDHSLVWQEARPGGDSRYLMLETVREYGWEHLEASGEVHVLRRRHAASFLALAEEAAPGMRSPEQIAWLDRLEAELPNLRAALGWLRDAGDTAHGLRLAAALWTFWVVRGRVPEGRHWLEAFLTTGAVASPARTAALVALGDLAQRQGDYAAAMAWIEEAPDLTRAGGDRAGEAAALRGLGNVAISRGAEVLHQLGDAALAEAEFARAEACLEQAVALARELGDQWGTARALLWLTSVRWARGDAAGAVAPCEEATAAFRRLGDRWQLSQAVAAAGIMTHARGDLSRARAAFAEALTLAQHVGYRWIGGVCLVGLAAVAAEGEGERAARLLGAAAALREAAGEPFRRSDQVWHDRAAAVARSTLGEAAFAAAWAAGAALPPEAAIAEALAWAAAPAERSPEPGAPAALGHLTPREVEVLRLLARRWTDKEIAEALFLSPRTVGVHVTSVLGKLGVSNRREAAAAAARLGLA